jgi:hypothetical protein
MPLPEKRDHRIKLAEATELTAKHRKEGAGGGNAEFFHREAFDQLLAQPGCAGIRIYRGKGAKGEHHSIMVGVDATGADMVKGGVMQQGLPCPPYCDAESPLVRGA